MHLLIISRVVPRLELGLRARSRRFDLHHGRVVSLEPLRICSRLGEEGGRQSLTLACGRRNFRRLAWEPSNLRDVTPQRQALPPLCGPRARARLVDVLQDHGSHPGASALGHWAREPACSCSLAAWVPCSGSLAAQWRSTPTRSHCSSCGSSAECRTQPRAGCQPGPAPGMASGACWSERRRRRAARRQVHAATRATPGCRAGQRRQ